MNYSDIAREILSDAELLEKYSLPKNVDLMDNNVVSTVLRKIVDYKNEHRDERMSSTQKVTRDLNQLFKI
jgi:hypothetical protein